MPQILVLNLASEVERDYYTLLKLKVESKPNIKI